MPKGVYDHSKIRGKVQSDVFVKKRIDAAKNSKYRTDSSYRAEKLKGRHWKNSEEFKDAKRKLWLGSANPMKNKKSREKAIRNSSLGNNKRPNKAENNFLAILKDCELPFVYNYADLIIENKIPDFYHLTKKMLIEFNGDYWHKTKTNNDNAKLKIYAKNGYLCLTVWESELKNISELKRKLISYENCDL